MEPIVMKNEAIQDEAILSKCRDELNKLFNKVDGFPIEKLGDKGKFISAKLYNSYRLKATTDSITRQFVWEYDRRLSRSRPDNYRALESFGGLWDIMPDKLSKDFVRDPGKLFHVGDIVNCYVIGIDKKHEKISVSLLKEDKI